MTYEVNFTDPTKTPIIIPPRSINTTSTDVALFGYTNLEYGEPLNEAMLHLLENFATPARGTNSTEYRIPSTDPIINKYLKNPIEGQYWFNKTRNALFVFHSGEWHEIAMGSHVAANWGVILDGQTIPRPISRFGYVFPYSECAWSVSPRRFTREADWFTCLTDNQGAVSAAIRHKGGDTVFSMTANYLIIGIKGGSSIGTVRPIPCPPTGVTITRRQPTVTPTTLQTTDVVTFDLQGVAAYGTQGPVEYQWELTAQAGPSEVVPATDLWDVTFSQGGTLNEPRIIGTFKKKDPTNTISQSLTFKVTLTDGCNQTVESTYVVTTAFTQREIPTVPVINCADNRVVPVTIGESPVTSTHTLTVNRPVGARWRINWLPPTVGVDCTGITCSVVTSTETSLTLQYTVNPAASPGTSTCVITIPHQVVDLDTLATTSTLTCSSSITRTTLPATTVPPLNISYGAEVTRNIGNLGDGSTTVLSAAPSRTGGTAPYSYSITSSDISGCTTAGATVTGITVSPTTGVVTFVATPPASGTSSGSCDVAVTVQVTDGTSATDTAVMTRRVSWGVPDQAYVNSITATCPTPITIMSAGSAAGTRTATVTIPVVVRDQNNVIMTTGYALDWIATTTCNLTATPSSGTVIASGSTTNVSFDVLVPQFANFTCANTVITITARNTDATWSSVTRSASCSLTVTADATVTSPLTVTFSNASTLTGTSQSCDGVPSESIVTVIGTISGGTAPYAVNGSGFSLTGLSCPGTSYVTSAVVSGSTITATVRMPSGTSIATCNGTIDLHVRDASATTASMGPRSFSLVRTNCVPACWSADTSGIAGSSYCNGVMYATSPGGPLVGFTGLDPASSASSYTPCGSICACTNSTSYSTSGNINNNPVRENATRYNATPASRLQLIITIPGVGSVPVQVVTIAPTNTASSTTSNASSVTIGGRTYTVTLTLTSTLNSSWSTGRNWTLASSWVISPTLPLCTSSGGGGGPGPGGGGGPGCFAEDMLVLRPDGSTMRIVDLTPGMEIRGLSIYGADELEHWRTWKAETLHDSAITTVMVNDVKRIVSDHYYVINKELKATSEHPLLAQRMGQWKWINVSQLQVGDVLYSSTRGSVPVVSVDRVEEALPVVLVDVEDTDTYFVGTKDQLILAHNKEQTDTQLN